MLALYADTIRKYKLLFRQLEEYGDGACLHSFADFTFEELIKFRSDLARSSYPHASAGA